MPTRLEQGHTDLRIFRQASGQHSSCRPGAHHYDKRKKDGDRHSAAQRNLFGRLLGCLHHCLATGQRYNEHIAFPAAFPQQQAAA